MLGLEKVLFFTNHQKILKFLLDNPEQKYYDREIANITGVSRAGANFALRDLAKIGIIDKEKKGKMNFYHVSLVTAIVKELKTLLNILTISELIDTASEYSSKIVLFGSALKGENTQESDLDILFITDDKEKVHSIILKDKNREKIQPVIATQNDFIKMKKENPVFYNEINNGKILWIKK
ncbi:MAG: nucleotidyltransferase domain-containing protein [Elusimicrobia bacterium]|nr:nucleotidyltransferase domain-containing protein [Candidatus Liberimonas magnetica]